MFFCKGNKKVCSGQFAVCRGVHDKLHFQKKTINIMLLNNPTVDPESFREWAML